MPIQKRCTLARSDDLDPTGDLDPTDALTVRDLAGLLKQVSARAGSPSLRALERAADRANQSLPRSSVAEMLAGKRLPRQELLLTFLEVCGLPSSALPRWLAVWDRLAAREADPTADRRAPFGDDLINDLRTAGLARIGTTFMTGLNWAALFAGVRELDIYVAYGQTWTRMNSRDLALAAARPGTRIRVILADPEDALTVELLADRFATTKELRRRIHTTRADYTALRCEDGATIDIRYRPGDRTLAFYRFDDTAVLNFYSHTRSRAAAVPVLVCRRPGALFDFVAAEWEAVLAGSRPV
ncbi:hypothetical protein ACFYTC_18520 [Actinomadura nitritigenes]|uniref:hypothetical protein n=1 Tax=Actinomadura nitritigenes TaxID=134602 RepID=UPI0036A22389